MQAGRLDKRIDLQRQVKSNDRFGQKARTWETFATKVPARLVPLGGSREQVLEGERQARADREFEIRFRADVTPETRVLFEEREWDVLTVDPIGRRAGLRLTAKARAE